MPPVVVVIHRTRDADDYLEKSFNDICTLPVKQADEKEMLQPGTVYVAPPNYHLLLEDDLSFSLSVEGDVNFARPSVDVLFESAAEALEDRVVAVVLTGANDDGSRGMAIVKAAGGLTVVQDPKTAEAPSMPKAAIERTGPHVVMPLDQIGPFLARLAQRPAPAAADGPRDACRRAPSLPVEEDS